eukprot:m.1544348 g.1544348  ORF g.1544348 m.1544348 type:complete len:93 (-) comp25258_c0_seq3:8028-8306(-)
MRLSDSRMLESNPSNFLSLADATLCCTARDLPNGTRLAPDIIGEYNYRSNFLVAGDSQTIGCTLPRKSSAGQLPAQILNSELFQPHFGSSAA